MSKPLTLTQKIFNVISVASQPMTASEIRRALPDAVEASEVSTRLLQLANRQRVMVSHTFRRALTGKKLIKCYSIADNVEHRQDFNILTALPQTQ